MENLDQAIAEIERLRKDGEKLQGELSGKPLEPLKHLDLQVQSLKKIISYTGPHKTVQIFMDMD